MKKLDGWWRNSRKSGKRGANYNSSDGKVQHQSLKIFKEQMLREAARRRKRWYHLGRLSHKIITGIDMLSYLQFHEDFGGH